jgi:phage protein D
MSPQQSGSSARSSVPSYKITIGSGHTFEQPEGDGVQSIVIEDHVDMISMFTIRLGGTEGQPEWDFNIGDEVEARLGEGDALLFKGQVVALEPSWTMDGGSTLTIRALDPLHKLGRGRNTRFWEDVLDSDIVSEIGAECGLPVEVDATGTTMPYVLQRNETDIAFLKRLAARNNYTLRVDNGTLKFQKNQYTGAENAVSLGGNLRSLRVAFNSVDQVSEVVVRGWDIAAKEEVVGTAATGDLAKVGDGDLGCQLAETAFSSSTAYITDVPVGTQAQANAIALAELERLARQFARGTGTIQGNDAVRAGTVVNLEGIAAPFNGKYFVLASRHIISPRTGYTTEFTFCSNTFGSSS